MKIELSLRDAQILLNMLKRRIDILEGVNDENYPCRAEDTRLVNLLTAPADPHWNK